MNRGVSQTLVRVSLSPLITVTRNAMRRKKRKTRREREDEEAREKEEDVLALKLVGVESERRAVGPSRGRVWYGRSTSRSYTREDDNISRRFSAELSQTTLECTLLRTVQCISLHRTVPTNIFSSSSCVRPWRGRAEINAGRVIQGRVCRQNAFRFFSVYPSPRYKKRRKGLFSSVFAKIFSSSSAKTETSSVACHLVELYETLDSKFCICNLYFIFLTLHWKRHRWKAPNVESFSVSLLIRSEIEFFWSTLTRLGMLFFFETKI